jgi:uncharacterized protein with PIN domain
MKFLADRTVGKLVKLLRVLGYDVEYKPSANGPELARTAALGGRTFLTRNQRLRVEIGNLPVVWVQANDTREQLKEVLTQLDLKPDSDRFFSRCLLCNEELLAIPKEGAEGKVPDFIYRSYDSFHVCSRCKRIYWPGTHLQRMKKELERTVGV